MNKTYKRIEHRGRMVKVEVEVSVSGGVTNFLEKSLATAKLLLEACARWAAENVRANLPRIVFVLIATLITLPPLFMYVYLREHFQRHVIPVLMSVFFAIPVLLSFLLPPGKRKGALRKSLELLGHGLMDPFPTFMASFLIFMGFLFAVEEVGGDPVRDFLGYVVSHINGRPVTCRSIILLVIVFLSSCVAAWSVPKYSRQYRDFAELTAGVIVRILYILIVTALWLLSTGLGSPEPSQLKVLGFSVLLLWLYVWASVCLEEWRRSRRPGRELNRTSHR